MLVFNLVP